MADFTHLNDFSILLRRFHEKFTTLCNKVCRVLENNLDEDSYDVYVNSILVDCRAIFIENHRYKYNCTIQNFYKATGHPEYANEIDAHFDTKIVGDATLRDAIKNWVDKHIVHFDFVDADSESAHLDGVLAIINRQTINNLFVDIMLFARQYGEYRQFLRNQADEVIQAMTGDPNITD